MLIKLKPFLLFIVFLPYYTVAICQEKRDTIYFDENWSICEKPVAEYYRICTLNKDSMIFYKDDVEDYFISGQLEMKGHYNNKGLKEGAFNFYNRDGSALIKGQFSNNKMTGNWLFYDSLGRMNTIFNCKSEADFTPLMIINKNGDTILNNGNGKFVFNMQEQLPAFYYGKKSFIIEGTVKNRLKEDVFNCYNKVPQKQLFFSLTYKNGKLKNNKTIYDNIGYVPVSDFQFSLIPSNLSKIDQFNHTNFVFELIPDGFDAEKKLVNFLVDNETPLIEANAKNTNDNDELFFSIIKSVLYDSLLKFGLAKDPYFKRFKPPVTSYFSAAFSKDEKNSFLKIIGNIVLTVDTAGYIVNAVYNSNLTKGQIDKIAYYFSHIVNLYPYYINAEKIMHNVNLKLNMLIDTLKNDSFHVSYLIYNEDLVVEKDPSKYIETSSVYSFVQVEAKYPGDWTTFLQRNLNAVVPADNNAPNGKYTVTVSFLVDVDGSISEVEALNNPGYGTAEEAVRVMKKMPRWMPAIKDGKNVKYRQKQNIVFLVTGG